MADGTHIEWTDATWNPITGCSLVSPGCTNCYAMKLAGTRLRHHPSRAGLTIDTKAGPVWNGRVRLNKQWLDQPLRWKRPRMIFVCAHGDLFHEDVPDGWIDHVFAVMAIAARHTFQVLTKRSDRMRRYLVDAEAQKRIGRAVRDVQRYHGWPLLTVDAAERFCRGEATWPLSNVWLGVSAEDQARAEGRIPQLLFTPATVRFLSAEPLLGPIDLTSLCTSHYFIDAIRGRKFHDAPDGVAGATEACPALDQVIVGGESGADARPIEADWVRWMRDDCASANVPFFFKQWGNQLPAGQMMGDGRMWEPTCGSRLRASKAIAGRFLDGVEHNGMPKV